MGGGRRCTSPRSAGTRTAARRCLRRAGQPGCVGCRRPRLAGLLLLRGFFCFGPIVLMLLVIIVEDEKRRSPRRLEKRGARLDGCRPRGATRRSRRAVRPACTWRRRRATKRWSAAGLDFSAASSRKLDKFDDSEFQNARKDRSRGAVNYS